MTSVPKPLSFLKNHYTNIKKYFDNMINKNKPKYRDLMSILAMVMEDPKTRQC